jgi:hypothetical protein
MLLDLGKALEDTSMSKEVQIRRTFVAMTTC